MTAAIEGEGRGDKGKAGGAAWVPARDYAGSTAHDAIPAFSPQRLFAKAPDEIPPGLFLVRLNWRGIIHDNVLYQRMQHLYPVAP